MNYNGVDMPKSLQILFRDARSAIEAAVRADLAQNGFGDVTPAHSALLRDIGDDGARPSDLAAHAGVTRQAITKLVDELERLDLVRRDPDPEDGRGVIVRYTDRGRAGVAIARKRMLALERAYAAQVGADRWAEVRSTLETLFGDDPPEDLSPPAVQTYPIGNAWTAIKHARPVSERSGSGSAPCANHPPNRPHERRHTCLPLGRRPLGGDEQLAHGDHEVNARPSPQPP